MAQANIKAVITAEDRASKALSGFGRSVDNMNDKIVAGAKRATQALAIAAAGATAFAVKSAADFEQTRIGLENMLGSADKAKSLLRDISKFAAETPFEFPELAQATRQLVAFGFSAEDAFDTMKQLGNVSAAVGAPINDLAYLMGTLRAQGRAFTIDIRQFAMRGIPIYEYLGKVLKADGEELQAMIESGQVGFPEVQKAFQLLAGEGGKWGNTMERQSKSLTGLFSTLRDIIGQTARELVGITQEGDIKEGSLMDNLRKGVTWLTLNLPRLLDKMREWVGFIRDEIIPKIRFLAEVVASYLGPKLQALWKSIQENLIPALQRLWKGFIEPLLPVLGILLVGAIGLIIDVLKILVDNIDILMPVLAGLGAFILSKNVIGAFTQLSSTIHSAGGVTGALKTLNKNITAMIAANPWAILAAAAVIAFVAIQDSITKTKQALDDLDAAMAGADRSDNESIGKLQKSAAAARKRGDTAEAARIGNVIRSITARTEGGPVTGNQPYVVGERGPELFVPHKSGTVIPNHGMGGSVNITIQAGAFMGSEQDARKFAKKIMGAWQDYQSAHGAMA